MPDYLDQALAAYAAFDPCKIGDRVRALFKLAALHAGQGDVGAAAARHAEALCLIQPDHPDCRAAGLMEHEDALRCVAEQTQRPDDLRAVEAIAATIDVDMVCASIADAVVGGWLRLGLPEEAGRCLAAGVARDPEWPRRSTDYVENLARAGRLTDALVAVELDPGRKQRALTRITRVVFEVGDRETARRMYREAWEAYRDKQIDAEGRAGESIAWNTSDCRNLVALGELELLNEALGYVGGFIDPHPIDFWLELAEAFSLAGDKREACAILNAFAGIVRGYDSPSAQAAKRITLARLLRRQGHPRRAAAYVAAVRRTLGSLPGRDERYYLYDQLIRYHLEHGELREAQTLCRQARLWLLGKAANETCASLKGFVESGLLALYGQAGLTDELAELAGAVEAVGGGRIALALADAWVRSHALAQGDAGARAEAEQAIARIEEAYWRFEMWLALIERTHRSAPTLST